MRIFESPVILPAAEEERLKDVLRALGGVNGTGFVDIETTGFARSYDTVYLVGLLTYEDGSLILRQYLGEDYRDEMKLLDHVLSELTALQTLITYNGELFDVPFLRDRAKRYRLWDAAMEDWQFHVKSIDLFRRFRAYQTFFGWPNLKLKTVEACLGATRRDAFDGSQLIDVFDEYTKTNDERLEKVLLLHNYEDIKNLLNLMKVEEFTLALKRGKAQGAKMTGTGCFVDWSERLPLSLEAAVPLLKNKKGQDPLTARLQFQAEEAGFTVLFPACRERIHYYLPSPGDYYYLPAEGSIVHKSLAGDIPASERRKARAEECRIEVYDPNETEGAEPRSEAPYIGVKPEGLTGLKLYRPEVKSSRTYAATGEMAAFLENLPPEELTKVIKTYFSALLGTE